MSASYDVAAIGNAIVDVIAPADDAFLVGNDLVKGSMMLIDEQRAHQLYGKMAAGLEASGGSAGNTVAGVASLGGRAAYVGKVAADQLGDVFAHDTRQIGVHFVTARLNGGAATGRSLINVTPDGERTMCTFLQLRSVELTADDVDADVIMGCAEIVYLEGYLFDPPEARRAFAKAAGLARASGRTIALTLSDLVRGRAPPGGAARVHRERGRRSVRQRGRDHLAVRGRHLRRGSPRRKRRA